MEFKNLDEKELLEIDGGYASASSNQTFAANSFGISYSNNTKASGDIVAATATDFVAEKTATGSIFASSSMASAIGTPTIVIKRPFHHR